MKYLITMLLVVFMATNGFSQLTAGFEAMCHNKATNAAITAGYTHYHADMRFNVSASVGPKYAKAGFTVEPIKFVGVGAFVLHDNYRNPMMMIGAHLTLPTFIKPHVGVYFTNERTTYVQLSLVYDGAIYSRNRTKNQRE